MFFVDGTKFIDMERKPLTGNSGNTGRYSSNEIKSIGENEKPKTSATKIQSGFNKPHPQPIEDDNTFDPFNDKSSDPFANNKPVSANNVKVPARNSVTAAKPTTTTKPATAPVKETHAPVVNLLDSFDDEPIKPAENNGFSSTFDPFGSNNPNTTNNNGFDSFETTKNVTKTSSGFDNFDNSILVSKSNEFDAFSTSKTTNSSTFDPFNNQPINNKPQRRASAQEIALDFTGLNVTSAEPEPVFVSAPVVVEEQKTEASGDVWSHNLVNLNLIDASSSGRGVPQKPLRSSLGGGQNQIQPTVPLFNTPPTQFSIQTNSNHPFGTQPPMNPFGGGINSTTSIPRTSFTSANNNVPIDPFSNLTGLPQPQKRTSVTSSQPLNNSVPGSVGLNSNTTPVMSNRPGGFNVSPQQPPKSSLDSFDWRT